MGMIKEERRIIFALNETQIKTMRSYLTRHEQPKYLLLFNFAIRVGLRISDILPIRVKHVRGKDRFKIIEQKTKKERTVYIPYSLQDEIQAYTEYMKEDDFLFPSRQGNSHLKRVRVYSVFNEAGKRLGFDHPMGTHTFRRTFGTMVYNQTKDIIKVQRLLNHSSPAITERYLGFEQRKDEEFMMNFDI